ncbi:MAG: hypothetical protein DMG24_18455 [Acidobacteria bacterium]|nr:MAG: hypothetical protein DMG24_18455 [Acidobacteriota bacterium]
MVKVLAVTNVYTEEAYLSLKSSFPAVELPGSSEQWKIADSLWLPQLCRAYFFLVNYAHNVDSRSVCLGYESTPR